MFCSDSIFPIPVITIRITWHQMSCTSLSSESPGKITLTSEAIRKRDFGIQYRIISVICDDRVWAQLESTAGHYCVCRYDHVLHQSPYIIVWSHLNIQISFSELYLYVNQFLPFLFLNKNSYFRNICQTWLQTLKFRRNASSSHGALADLERFSLQKEEVAIIPGKQQQKRNL